MDEVKVKALELLAEGLTTEEISRRLGVSKQTVAAYRAHVTMGTYAERAQIEGAVARDETENARNLKFGLERDMQEALRSHMDQLDPGLRIADDGKERHVEAGFIDILVEDQNGTLVVIELKSGEAPDSAITQLLSYVGPLREETSQTVRGMLVAREFPARVRYAARAAGIRLVKYGHEFTFTTVDEAGPTN